MKFERQSLNYNQWSALSLSSLLMSRFLVYRFINYLLHKYWPYNNNNFKIIPITMIKHIFTKKSFYFHPIHDVHSFDKKFENSWSKY